PAVGTGHERVPVTPVARVEQLGDTGVAHRDVGRNRRLRARDRPARHDPELTSGDGLGVRACQGDAGYRDGTDPGQRRGLGTKPAAEILYGGAFALNLEKPRTRIVADESGQAQLAGDSVDERPKANPLNNTGHGEVL